jgi:hypothetical protein
VPWSWKITTITSSSVKVLAQLQQPAIADPAELPAKIPSSRAIRRVIIAASLSVTFSNVVDDAEVDVLAAGSPRRSLR